MNKRQALRFIRYSKNKESRQIYAHHSIINIWNTKQLMQLFSWLLKARVAREGAEKSSPQQHSAVEFDWYRLELIRSVSCQSFFIEIHIWDTQISSLRIPIKNERIVRQCEYFKRMFPQKKDMFDKIISLYSKNQK